MKKRSGFRVMLQLVGLVKHLAGFMVLAVFMPIPFPRRRLPFSLR